MNELIQAVVADIGKVLLGKDHQVRLALTCFLARGHLLLEDLPGMGKTTLAHAMAKVLGLAYNRVQFTSDLLPADILGVSIFDRSSNGFSFHPGPIFTQLLLADEINRTTPKTQSALLEAMAEQQVTIDGESRSLPDPFFVIATQNPLTQSGTFPLPESQLDRFLMRIELGYPSPAAELSILKDGDPSLNLQRLQPRINLDQLQQLQFSVENVHVSDSLLAYLQRLIEFTRTSGDIQHGISTRGALALLRCAKAWALIEGRGHLLPDDIQAVMPSVIGHRLQSRGGAGDQSGFALVATALNSVDVVGG